MFTNEFKFDYRDYTRDWIRLVFESQQKLKDGDLDVYELIKRANKKIRN